MNPMIQFLTPQKIVILLALLLAGAILPAHAQVNPMGTKLDETQLMSWPGTTTVTDATADGGNAIFRPASAGNNTMWFGPYWQFQGGNYLVQFRLKVASNSSGANLIQLDVYSYTRGMLGALLIKPNMFRNSNEWQLFTLPVQLPSNISDIEIRGVAFTGGITDLSLDYITIIPGDLRGFYSNEFTVAATGGVGIGTQNLNGYMLAVKGNVHAQQVNVDLNNWADYVFAPAYHLPRLMEVKNYIGKYHHLPDMPSEQEVAKDGINLGEMNKLLTKKVEELTLYLIEKDKEIKEQNSKIKALEQSQQAQIDELKQQILILSKHK